VGAGVEVEVEVEVGDGAAGNRSMNTHSMPCHSSQHLQQRPHNHTGTDVLSER
jgi:hypothetical protein